MSVVCACPRDHLCDPCLAQALRWFGGVAQVRGGTWAGRVAARHPELLGRPWPDDERARVMAARQIADLTRDPRLVAELVPEVQAGAERAWEARRRR